MKHKLLLIGILLLSAFFRLYGFNWDQNQHLHPDERFLTMVSTAISWPRNLNEYLDTAISPLNPHNRNFSFFVYGTFPIFFTKWVAESLGKGDYTNLTLVGRQLSALFDIGTVILVFLIGKQRSRIIGLLAAFFYAASVLPIQLSHFYAVDTYLTFFITLSFYLLIRIISFPKILNTIYYILYTLLGFSFGLALASKISAMLFLPVIGLGLIIACIKNKTPFFARPVASLLCFGVLCSLFFVSTYFTFRLAQPYLFANPDIFDFTLNPKVLDNWKQLKSFDDVSGGFPPAIQWIYTKPYIFPLKNLILWGLGLPLGIITLLAISYRLWVVGYELIKRKFNSQLTTHNSQLNLIVLWILILFFYQGFQFVKALRYFFPIYPFLAILSGYFISKVFKKYKIGLFVYLFICIFVLVYPLSFITIYSRSHSRVEASNWIYINIPPGAKLSGEHWDDYLPLSLPGIGKIHEKYQSIEFPLYWPDTQDKWKQMIDKLSQADYIIMSSNRLYGSILTNPKKYPVTEKYYQTLFDGSLGFEKVAEFTSRPNIPLPFIKLCLTPLLARYGIIAKKDQRCDLNGISFVDDYADETFTVYDHPKILIFKKVRPVNYYSLLYR